MSDEKSTGRRGPGRPTDEVDRRERILQAAGEAFLEHGFEAPVRVIAESAGVSTAAVYYYFPTKDALLVEAAVRIGRVFDRMQSDLREDVELRELLDGLARTYLSAFADPAAPRLILQMFMQGGRMPEAFSELAHRLDRVLAPVRRRLAELQEAGRIRNDIAPEVLAQTFFGALFSFVMARKVLRAPWLPEMEDEAVARAVACIVADGVSKEGGGA
ncbi:MAG: hypothetical protein Kow00129_17660 [Thermoleophilia bacterium]